MNFAGLSAGLNFDATSYLIESDYINLNVFGIYSHEAADIFAVIYHAKSTLPLRNAGFCNFSRHVRRNGSFSVSASFRVEIRERVRKILESLYRYLLESNQF